MSLAIPILDALDRPQLRAHPVRPAPAPLRAVRIEHAALHLTSRLARPSPANARRAPRRGEGSSKGQNSARDGKTGQHGAMVRRQLDSRNPATPRTHP